MSVSIVKLGFYTRNLKNETFKINDQLAVP